MINAVYFKPHVYSSGYNPIVWSFSSDKNTQVDFSYVVDIYVNSATGSTTPTYRLKQRPNLSGTCMVDVSSIVQPYIELTDYAVEQGWSKYYRDSTEITPSVFIKVGEEYQGASGGALTIYNGYGATGAPAYPIYSLEQTGYPVIALPAALPWEDGVESMAATGGYGYFSDYMMGGTGAGLTGSGLFLKRGGNSVDIRSTDQHTLSFLNWNWQFSPGTYGRPIQGIQVKAYNSSGTLHHQGFYQNTISNGGGPNSVTNYTNATWNRIYSMLTFKCGPQDLGYSSDPNVAYYTVQAFYKDTATSSSAAQRAASELVTFTIDNPCENLYPVVRLSWLNDLGGRDYYNFDMFYEMTSSSKEETYSVTPLNWSGNYPVVVDAYPANTSPNWLRGGSKSFNKVVERTFTIQSDWLTQAEVDLLGQIPESPSVWAYIGSEPIPYTIIITKADYTYKNIKQTKLVQATFECKMTKTQPKQNY